MYRISNHTAALAALCLSLSPATAGDSSPAINEPSGALRLSDVVALTLAYSPQLAPYSWDVRIGEAAAVQAAARPNPELGLDIENALGAGDLESFDGAEETLSLSQTIELGRKREKRMAVAGIEIELARQSYLLKRSEVLNAAIKAFLDVLAAQQEKEFAEQSLTMQRELAEAQEERVKAGKLSESERESARAALALAEIAAANADAEVRAARSMLGAFWNRPKPKFSHASGALGTGGALPSYQSYQSDLADNPVLAFHGEQIRRHQAAVQLQEAQAAPDLTIGIGARHFEESGGNAAVLSFSLPLPLFDRKRGDIEKARAELGKAGAETAAAKAALEAALAASHARLSAAYRESAAVGSAVMPAAKRGYDFAREGYKLGKFSYLELQAAQDTLLQARAGQLRARIRFHKAKADLDTLAGRTH
jgi:cobalt-zinc-cadmium efflux system outer membrane protein